MFRYLDANSKVHNYSPQISDLGDEVFETDADDNVDDDEVAIGLNANEDNDDSRFDDDCTDEEEQNNTRDLTSITKNNFSGVKAFDKMEPRIEHTYFEAKINHDTKCLHKQTAC